LPSDCVQSIPANAGGYKRQQHSLVLVYSW